MNRRRKAIYYLLILVLLFNYAIALADNGVGELKKKQNNTKQEMNQKEKEIKSLKNQTKDVSSQIEELDKEMDLAATELEKVKEEIDTLNQDIQKTMEELKEAENKIADKQEVFDSRLRVMYKNGNIGYLEVLLASEDIGDFLSRREMLQSIANHDVDLLKHMREQRDIINEKNTELKAKRASKEAARSKLDSRKQDLARASRAKENLMTNLNKDLKKAEEEYDALTQLAKDIESKIVSSQRVNVPYSGSSSKGSSGGPSGSSSGGTSGGGGGSYSGSMTWPVPGHGRISSPYGWRVHPIFKTKKLHTGIDIPAPHGVNVTAVADGVVIHSGPLGGYGNTVIIDHGGGISTLYGHNSSLTVGNGAKVSKGTVIARIGSTGYSTGPHCHFEVRKNGGHIDPIPWLRGN